MRLNNLSVVSPPWGQLKIELKTNSWWMFLLRPQSSLKGPLFFLTALSSLSSLNSPEVFCTYQEFTEEAGDLEAQLNHIFHS